MPITLLAAILQACATARPPRPATGAVRPPPGRTAVVTVRVDERKGASRIRRLPLEEYVAGCVDAELGRVDLDPLAARRMRRVQAILCRTYTMANLGRHAAQGFDLCATTHCQLYRQLPAGSLSAEVARQGAQETAGLVIEVGGRPINALFHSNCGGRTSRAEAVWGGSAVPYLVSRADPACANAPGWRVEVALGQLQRALRADPRTDIGSRFSELRVGDRDEGGRVTTVTLLGATVRSVRAETFRAVIAQALGPVALRSTRFTVRRDGETFIFEGRGSGHGVGLCQAGAIARVRAGQSEAEVLTFYYPGTRLVPMAGLR